jgi:hypothetical protein
VTFGNDGRVSRVVVDPPYAGTTTASCLEQRFGAARTLPFEQGDPVTIGKSLTIRRPAK